MSSENDTKIYFDQINLLSQRRQGVTTSFLSVNSAIIGALAFIIKDGKVTTLAQQTSVFVLLIAGLISCDLWRRLVTQYSQLLNWWYKEFRTAEQHLFEKEFAYKRIITKEYHDLYEIDHDKSPGVRTKNVIRPIGMTKYEIRLTWLFSSIYILFSLAILSTIIISIRFMH